ncbi:MAG: 50S ribosomal protein L11 methyltransferase [Rhizobacter sp.]|nr:50S ribosomal protein L11 methyltransferase [Rhizobacter sp.]
MYALSLLAPAAAVDALSDLLAGELDALSVSIEDADAGSAAEQPVFDEPGVAAGSTWAHARVTALFVDEALATMAAASVAAQGDSDVHVVAIAAVEDHDWVRLTQAQFGPCRIAEGFWIVPTWSEVPDGARHVIRLDPGRAFGTGTHPTTRMCLRWIAEHGDAGGTAWPRVLDYGCGSGVLAIAASRFGAGAVDAVDVDPAAVETTYANAKANGVVVRAGAPDIVAGRYALVVANILAAPLELLAPALAALVDDGGALVLSGILDRQVDAMRATYAPWLALAAAAHDEGWALLVGRRTAKGGMA